MPDCSSNPDFSMTTAALGGGGVERGGLGAGVTGGGVTGGRRGVGGGVSAFGCGFGVLGGVAGGGLGRLGFGVAAAAGVDAGACGIGVDFGFPVFGFGLGFGAARSGGGVAGGKARISSRARRNCRRFSSSARLGCCAWRSAPASEMDANNRSEERRTGGPYQTHWGIQERLLAAVVSRSADRAHRARRSERRAYGVPMRPFLLRWLLTTIAVAAAAWVTGIRFDSPGALIGTALLLGIVNAFIRPVLLLLSLPFILVSLGLFILVVNAFLLWMVGSLIPGAHVDGFWQSFFGSLIISVVSWLLSSFFKASDGRYHTIAHHSAMKRVEGRIVEEQ